MKRMKGLSPAVIATVPCLKLPRQGRRKKKKKEERTVQYGQVFHSDVRLAFLLNMINELVIDMQDLTEDD